MLLRNIVKGPIIIIALMIIVCGLTGCDNTTKCRTAKAKRDIKDIKIDLKNERSFENKSLYIKDEKMINDIISMINQSRSASKKDELNDVSAKYSKLTINKVDGDKIELFCSYDPVHQKGFVKTGSNYLIPKYDFFRYVEDLAEYSKTDTDLDDSVVDLFKKYDWTVDYRINTIKEKLPKDFKHKASEYPTKIYWAYNNEFSKAIGLDFSEYLGKRVDVEIYRLRESLPESLSPLLNARGIVLKHKGEIIGAYIDSGRHSLLACSLDRKTLKDITDKDWNKWVQKCIDYSDELEIRLSKMQPEDVIKEFFDALNKQDKGTVFACLTRKELCSLLSTNLDNRNLYNRLDESEVLFNIKRADLIGITKVKHVEGDPYSLEYQVKADVDFDEPIVEDDGVIMKSILMKKRSAKSGWRIDGICNM